MKLVLMGTPKFAADIFDKLADKHEIIAVFTRAPKPQGRKHILTPSPVYDWAQKRGIPVYTKIKDYNFSPDMVVVVSYGVILRDNVLGSAPCINIHPSDLPKYRGASPIKTALYNGDTKSAVCLMDITPQLDSGDVHIRRSFNIDINDTNEIVENRVAKIATDMLLDYLSDPKKYPPKKQRGNATFTRKYTGDDETIDWRRGARAIHNQIRALGFGRTKINGREVKILETKILPSGKLEILRVQPAGKKPMDWKSFKNGLRGEPIKFGC